MLLAGAASAGAGCAMILALPISPGWRLLAAALWLASSVREVVSAYRGQRCFDRIRLLQGGDALLRGEGGCWFPATLAAGSIVLRRCAWLRFETEDGRKFAELLRCRGPQNETWRRLHVIWRHLGASA